MRFSRKNLKSTNKTKQRGAVLIEYALLVALIAFAAVTGMSGLATGINSAFNNVAQKLTTTINTP